MTSGASDLVPLSELVDSWLLSLRAERKSPRTIRNYSEGVRRFLAWADETDTAPVLDKRTVNAFTVDLLDAGLEPTTVQSRLLALRRFSAWLADEGEIPRDDLLGLRRPKVDKKIIPSLTEAQAVALVRACRGNGLRDRRDEAIVRLMLETGARAGEVAALSVRDVDLLGLSVSIQRGKGGKGRVVPISAQTGAAIDRYLRIRRTHVRADSPALWLGKSGRGFGYHGLYRTLKDRAELAKIPKFHPHMLRHTAASRWLAAGGSEGGLMAVAGWSNRDMIDRYSQDTAAARAADEARRLNLGDL